MPPDKFPLLHLEDVRKNFGATRALEAIELEIARGSFTALLGPSGCGKSTLLRLVAGLDSPSHGRITWPDLDGATPKPGDIGFVFQEPTLMPWSDVVENIALPLNLLNRREGRDEDIHQLINSVGLAGFESALPRTLSGGMKMRVSLARALISTPRILLLDEPFAALDEITRTGLNDALLKLSAERELTTLFVTHSVFESVYLADRVLVFSPRPGCIVETFNVEAPEIRADSFRFTRHYTEQCRAVSDALARAMEAPRVA